MTSRSRFVMHKHRVTNPNVPITLFKSFQAEMDVVESYSQIAIETSEFEKNLPPHGQASARYSRNFPRQKIETLKSRIHRIQPNMRMCSSRVNSHYYSTVLY